MVKSFFSRSSRMTSQTGCTFIHVSRNTIMFFTGISKFMTCNTGIFCIISWVCMTIDTGIPFPFMFPRINREKLTIMVIACRNPAVFAMAFNTICWKISYTMIRFSSIVILILMTSNTRFRSINIITIMTIDTLICNNRMCSI